MLMERENVSQKEGEGFRRWFSDDFFDLIVWFSDKNSPVITGFQICYDKSGFERAMTWIEGEGYSHTQIDEGEGGILRNKMSPVLLPDGIFEKQQIGTMFKDAAASINDNIKDFVLKKIMDFS